MEYVEQALFAVNRKSVQNISTILSITSGIHKTDIAEIELFSSDFQSDFLFESSGNGPHLFFHPLPSGAFVFGKLIPCFPKQVKVSYFSHCLVIPAKLLYEFKNNAIWFYQELEKKKDFQFFEPSDSFSELQPFSLVPVPRSSDLELFEALYDFPGTVGMATLTRSCIDSVCTFFSDGPPVLHLLNGLIQCFPMDLRPEITFATGLHFSQSQPFRIMAVDLRSPMVRKICKDYVIPFFNFIRLNPLNFEKNNSNKLWPLLIYKVFESHRFEFLIQKLAELETSEYSAENSEVSYRKLLQQLGRRFLGELSSLTTSHSSQNALQNNGVSGISLFPQKGTSGFEMNHSQYRGDASHSAFLHGDLRGELNQETIFMPLSSHKLHKMFPKWEESLRKMDSLTARALFGDQTALEALGKEWRAVAVQLSETERGRISEAYIHLVQTVLTQPRDPDYPKQPRRSIDALEILNIFMER